MTMVPFMRILLFIVLTFISFGSARADQPGGLSARVIKLNFVTPQEVAPVLSEMKSAEGKVVVNEEGHSIVVMDTPERVATMEALVRQMDIQTVTAVLPLKFGRADVVVGEVRGLLTQSVGTIRAESAANTITVTDMPGVVDKVRRVVESFDLRGRKFIVEAKLIHITLDDEHVQGVDWAGIVADHQQFKLEGAYEFLGGRGRSPTMSLGTIEDKDLIPLIEALDTVGIVREYPVVDVLTGADAEVWMTVRFDEPVVSLAAGEGESTGEGAASIVFSLKAVVDADGSVKTTLLPLEPSAALKSAGVKTSPVARRPRIATVRTLDNGTIVVGGLIVSDNVLTLRKIPLMGDLPLLGFAFRYHNSSVRREEFVVLLTPKPVVQEPSAVSSADDKADY